MATKPVPVIPKIYRDALGDRDPLKAQQEAPARLRALIAGLDDRQLSTPEAPGKWSIKQVLEHLADGEVIYGARMRFVAGHDRPPIPGYDQDAFATHLGAQSARAEDLLRSFELMRAVNHEFLSRLPAGARARVGIHSERGEESIEGMFLMLAGHDFVHEAQIRRIRDNR